MFRKHTQNESVTNYNPRFLQKFCFMVANPVDLGKCNDTVCYHQSLLLLPKGLIWAVDKTSNKIHTEMGKETQYFAIIMSSTEKLLIEHYLSASFSNIVRHR